MEAFSVQLSQVLRELFISMNFSSKISGLAFCLEGSLPSLLKQLGEDDFFVIGGKTVTGLESIEYNSFSNVYSSAFIIVFIEGNSMKGFFFGNNRILWFLYFGSGDINPGKNVCLDVSPFIFIIIY